MISAMSDTCVSPTMSPCEIGLISPRREQFWQAVNSEIKGLTISELRLCLPAVTPMGKGSMVGLLLQFLQCIVGMLQGEQTTIQTTLFLSSHVVGHFIFSRWTPPSPSLLLLEQPAGEESREEAVSENNSSRGRFTGRDALETHIGIRLGKLTRYHRVN